MRTTAAIALAMLLAGPAAALTPAELGAELADKVCSDGASYTLTGDNLNAYNSKDVRGSHQKDYNTTVTFRHDAASGSGGAQCTDQVRLSGMYIAGCHWIDVGRNGDTLGIPGGAGATWHDKAC